MKRIAIIGDALVDYRRSGVSHRMSPEDPSCPVLTELSTAIELGGAANVAAWLAAQPGVSVTLFCHWALDDAGWDLKKLCRSAGIELSDIGLRRRGGCRTTRKERIGLLEPDRSQFQQIVRCDADTDCEMNESEVDLLRGELSRLPFDLLVVADYQKGMFAGSAGLCLRDFVATGRAVIVNSKRPSFWERLSLAALIFNRAEAQASWPQMPWDMVGAAARAHRVVMTQGADGVACNLLEENDSIFRTMWRAPSLAYHVSDVTGAGDAFTAGFASHFLRRPHMAAHASLTDSEVKACIHEGQRWAAHCCAQIGCGQPLISSALAAPETRENPTHAVPA